MEKNGIIIVLLMLLMAGFAACNDDDTQSGIEEPSKNISNPNSIIGVWELKTLRWPEGNREIPVNNRDIFTFSSNGKVKAIVNKERPLYPDLPNENGEYDYSYDEEQQSILLNGESLKCIISNGVMRMEGSHFGPDDGLYSHEIVFVKIQD